MTHLMLLRRALNGIGRSVADQSRSDHGEREGTGRYLVNVAEHPKPISRLTHGPMAMKNRWPTRDGGGIGYLLAAQWFAITFGLRV